LRFVCAHVNQFHTLYVTELADHAVDLVDKITELNTTYGLDSQTVLVDLDAM
jgi:hypothetical protein